MLVHRSYYVLGVVFLLVYLTTPTAQAHDGPHVTVQRGETLSMIAKQHNTDVQTLLSLNNLDNLNLIRSGHILALPGAETAPLQPEIDESEYVLGVEVVGEETLSQEAASAEILDGEVSSAEVVSAEVVSTEVVSAETLSEEAAPKEALPENQRLEHVVQNGEGLGTIASYYGLTALDLVAINDLPDPNLITPGTVLNVDASSIPSTMVPLDMPADVSADSAPITPTITSSLAVTNTAAVTNAPPTEEKWIDVDLSEQIVVAYEGATPVNRFIISSGLPWTPTVRGEFRIWAKTPIQDMYGGDEEEETDWYIEDVQWVQYFYGDYGFHGTYWHNKFGQPTSRGCINMRNEDAKWLFDWATPQDVQPGWTFSDEENPGTLVIVHD